MPSTGGARIWTRQTVEPNEFISPLELPAKGVGYHVLMVQASPTDILPRGQSVVIFRDSHGQMDQIDTACPPVQIPVICDVRCSECVIAAEKKMLQLPPGLFRAIGAAEVTICCPPE